MSTMDPILKAGIDLIQSECVKYVIEYLKTGHFNKPDNKKLVEAYSKVIELADMNNTLYPKALYQNFVSIITEYNVSHAVPKMMSKSGKELLWEFMAQWEKHGILVYWMKKIYTYLDRFYLPDHKMPSLSQTGLKIFKQEVFEKNNKIIVRTIFELIEAEREGEVVDWGRLKKILYCYRMMGLTNAKIEKEERSGELVWEGTQNLQYYKEMFEGEFIRQTTEFYKKQAEQWMQNYSCPEYVNAALAALKKEEDKVLNFLDKETKPKLLDSLEAVLVEENAQALTEKERTGVVDMFKDKRQEELRKLYQLLSRRKVTLPNIYEKMKPYIEGRGKAVIGDKDVLKDPVLFVNKLLELKKEMDAMVAEAFANDPAFMQTRDRAFQSFMNDCAYTPSFLGEYVDMLMRQGLKGKEANMEKYIDEAFDLFKLLKQKDAFTARHQQLYALRLLQNTSVSQDAEESLISKLKIELGAQYVSKLVQMGVDMKNSRDLTDNFRKQSHKGVVKGIDMTIKVLTTGLWGEQKNSRCKLPDEIRFCGDSFEAFYKQSHIGKNITWVAGLGDCEVKTTFASKPYTLIVTVYQTAILCLYNKDSVAYTYNQIKESTGLPDEELNAHLFPLMNPKLGKLLVKQNMKTPKCLPDEKITLNVQYASSSLRLTLIPTLHQAKKSVEEHDKDISNETKELSKLRNTIIQAQLVKIMKGRRKERHNELINEVIKQINSFKPDPIMIKQQIEWLIESDYLMRDEKDKGTYIYKP